MCQYQKFESPRSHPQKNRNEVDTRRSLDIGLKYSLDRKRYLWFLPYQRVGNHNPEDSLSSVVDQLHLAPERSEMLVLALTLVLTPVTKLGLKSQPRLVIRLWAEIAFVGKLAVQRQLF